MFCSFVFKLLPPAVRLTLDFSTVPCMMLYGFAPHKESPTPPRLLLRACVCGSQPDALAVGKPSEDLRREGCRPDLIPHRTFDGNRPSLSLLVPKVRRRVQVCLQQGGGENMVGAAR